MRATIQHHSAIMSQYFTDILQHYGLEIVDTNYDLIVCNEASFHSSSDVLTLLCLPSNKIDLLKYWLERGADDVLLLPCDEMIVRSKLDTLLCQP